MIASAVTLRRLLNRLPSPKRASLADIAAAAPMMARFDRVADRTPQLVEHGEQLDGWLQTAIAHHHSTGAKA